MALNSNDSSDNIVSDNRLIMSIETSLLRFFLCKKFDDSFIIIGQFVRNRGMNISPGTAKWDKVDLVTNIELAPGEEQTLDAFTLTPKEVPTGEFGFRVRIYRTNAAGEREKIEDDTLYQDLSVS